MSIDRIPTVDDLLILAAQRGDAGAIATLARRDEAAKAAAEEAIEGRIEAALAPVTTVLNRLGIGLGAIAGILRIPGMDGEEIALPPAPAAEPVEEHPDSLELLRRQIHAEDPPAETEEERAAPASLFGRAAETEEQRTARFSEALPEPVPLPEPETEEARAARLEETLRDPALNWVGPGAPPVVEPPVVITDEDLAAEEERRLPDPPAEIILEEEPVVVIEDDDLAAAEEPVVVLEDDDLPPIPGAPTDANAPEGEHDLSAGHGGGE